MEEDRSRDINKTFSLHLDEPPQLSSPDTGKHQLPHCSRHQVVLPTFPVHAEETSGQSRVVHHCTALNAAVIFGQVERVKALLAVGASMTVEDCTGSTAVSEAAYHNQVEAMKLLLDSGADVNTPNQFGLTPLAIASSSYKGMTMVNLLLKKGANVNLKAKDGRSALHLAAEGGHRYIMKKLLRCEFIDLKYLCMENSVSCPSPLILAASEGHVRIMEMLLEQFSFPQNVAIDSYLVLWAVFVLNIAQVKSPSDCDNYCRRALNMRESNNHCTTLRPVESINGVLEVKTVREFEELCLLDSMESKLAKACQSVAILERCLGPHSKLLVTALRKTALVYAHRGNLCEADRLLAKSLDIIAMEERELMKQDVYKLPVHLHIVVTSFMERLWKIWAEHYTNSASGYRTDFLLFTKGLLRVLDTLLQLKSKQQCADLHGEDEAFEVELMHVLTLFSCAIASSVFLGVSKDDKELEELGRDFVAQYKSYCSQYFTSLVHLTVSKIDTVLDAMRQVGVSSGDLGEDATLLVSALLRWGALDDVNTPYSCIYPGERLLNRAVMWASIDPCLLSLVSFLLDNGAHFCTINCAGIHPYQISCRPEVMHYFQPLLQSPLPLACWASKAVLASGIDYQSSQFIPSSMKRYISYHDDIIHSLIPQSFISQY